MIYTYDLRNSGFLDYILRRHGYNFAGSENPEYAINYWMESENQAGVFCNSLQAAWEKYAGGPSWQVAHPLLMVFKMEGK